MKLLRKVATKVNEWTKFRKDEQSEKSDESKRIEAEIRLLNVMESIVAPEETAEKIREVKREHEYGSYYRPYEKLWRHKKPIVDALVNLCRLGRVRAFDVIKFDMTGDISPGARKQLHIYLAEGYVNIALGNRMVLPGEVINPSKLVKIGRNLVEPPLRIRAFRAVKSKIWRKPAWFEKLISRIKSVKIKKLKP